LKKIPTVFVRAPDDLRRVIDAWHPDCLWVRDGEGVPTRKYDGTCVMFDGDRWWARRTVKLDAERPPGFWMVQMDAAAQKEIGWEPAEQSPFRKPLFEALSISVLHGWPAGTYELCGPKINGNPEGLGHHELFLHEAAQRITLPLRRDFETLRDILELLRLLNHVEGLVFHHPDGRMAKLKGRDFR
jgi:hypothetical protein